MHCTIDRNHRLQPEEVKGSNNHQPILVDVIRVSKMEDTGSVANSQNQDPDASFVG